MFQNNKRGNGRRGHHRGGRGSRHGQVRDVVGSPGGVQDEEAEYVARPVGAQRLEEKCCEMSPTELLMWMQADPGGGLEALMNVDRISRPRILLAFLNTIRKVSTSEQTSTEKVGEHVGFTKLYLFDRALLPYFCQVHISLKGK